MATLATADAAIPVVVVEEEPRLSLTAAEVVVAVAVDELRIRKRDSRIGDEEIDFLNASSGGDPTDKNAVPF